MPISEALFELLVGGALLVTCVSPLVLLGLSSLHLTAGGLISAKFFKGPVTVPSMIVLSNVTAQSHKIGFPVMFSLKGVLLLSLQT